jgi:hypothetical protein
MNPAFFNHLQAAKMNQFDPFTLSDRPDPLDSPPPALPLTLPENILEHTPDAPTILVLPPRAIYPTRETMFEAIQGWARPRGYAFSIAKSKETNSGRLKVHYVYDRRARTQPNKLANRVRNTKSRGSGCQFSILGV